MFKFTSSTQRLALAGAMLSTLLLVGCVGGTTYGTGKSQSMATVEDLSNMLALQKKRTRIEYKPRPDLVVPEQKQLVDPQQAAADAQATDWPETPEARIARIRAEAEEAQSTSAGRVKFAQSQKRYRSVRPGETKFKEAPIGQGVPNISCDPEGKIMRKCTNKEISKAVRAQRKEIKSVGISNRPRRYLTEPPIDYRTPASTAPIGDEGYTEAELKKIEQDRKQREEEANREYN